MPGNHPPSRMHSYAQDPGRNITLLPTMITGRIVPLALTALFLFELPLYSAETLLLPDTVVTASRIGEDSLESMSSLGVVTAEQFREQGFRTVPEALANTPGVMVQKTTHGHGSPFIRGFTGRQNLLLVDGVRINNSTYRSGPIQYWNTVDGFSMDRLELVRSQGSVQYGSDALGGTMNILTADTGYLAADPGWFQQGSAQYRFDTNSSSHVGRLQTRFGDGKNWGASLGLTGKNFGDIRDSGVGRMKNTGYPEQNLDLKVETLLNPSTRLSFAHQYLNQDDVWRWHSTIYNDTPWNNTSTGSYAARIYDQERSLTYLKVAGDLIDSPVQNYSATLSFQRSQDSAFQDRSATDVRTQVIDVDTIGLDVQLESDLLGGGSGLWYRLLPR